MINYYLIYSYGLDKGLQLYKEKILQINTDIII